MFMLNPFKIMGQLLLEESFEHKETLYEDNWWKRSGNNKGKIDVDIARGGKATTPAHWFIL